MLEGVDVLSYHPHHILVLGDRLDLFTAVEDRRVLSTLELHVGDHSIDYRHRLHISVATFVLLLPPDGG